MKYRLLIAVALVLGGLVYAALNTRLLPAAIQVSGYCGSVPAQAEWIPDFEPVVYRTASGRPLRIHILRPPLEKANRSAIIFFFGGGWRLGNIDAFADRGRAMAAKGYTIILPDYRVKCRDRSNILAAVEDAKASYAWARNKSYYLNIDPSRIILGGGSAGGHLAATVAMQVEPKLRPEALLLFNPALDIKAINWWLDLTLGKAADISPYHLPMAHLPPTIIFHGADDRQIPIEEPRKFCAKAIRAGMTCQLVEYKEQDHGFFHSRNTDPLIKASPFDDTVNKSLKFLSAIEMALPPH